MATELMRKHCRTMIILSDSVDVILGGGVSDEAWEQASLCAVEGGLGLREAASVALPALVASRIPCRPHIATLAGHLEEAEICTASSVLRKYDERTDAALIRLVSTLDSAAGVELVDELEKCMSAADDVWQHLLDEGADEAIVGPGAGSRIPRGPGIAVLLGDEDEDHEHPDGAADQTIQVQRLIMQRIDERKVAAVRARMDACCDAAGLRRLDELQDKNQDHS
eukprot:TRINITY_DN43906_c0_g1_i1.p1 TRINITY_DN43906_c0_g1~~TRINITY_DN43906_c0_g1_i1.p1  ORF type:complete len:224 (-),score=43.32 TRINITY_DN43906_c0_g1_i1:57-728(-)